MSSPSAELQYAVQMRLAADEELLAIVPIDLSARREKDRRFYDYIPEEAENPYIHFDTPQEDVVHVRPQEVVDVTFTLHLWHNQALTGDFGNYVPLAMKQAVKRALRFKLDMPNYEVVDVSIITDRIFDDVNPDVKHGVLTYRYQLEKK